MRLRSIEEIEEMFRDIGVPEYMRAGSDPHALERDDSVSHEQVFVRTENNSVPLDNDVDAKLA